jgi:hypothetical protein
MNLTTALRRYLRLGRFWTKRTTFYRDMATSLTERELPKDFVEGELQIAMTPATADKARATGLAFMRSAMDAGDPTLHEVLVASMPASDNLALTTLKDARDRPAALHALANTIDEQIALNKMVRQALFSPTVLVPVGFAFAYILSTVSIPEFAKGAPEEVWTGFNSLVRDSANWMARWGLWFLAGLVASLVWLLVWALPNLTARWRYRAEAARGWSAAGWTLVFPGTPVLRMYRDVQAARMLGNLANLLQSGNLLNEALATLAHGAQPWMQGHLLRVLDHLQREPGDYVGAFGHGVLSPFLLARMHSMVRRDAGGQFDKVLIDLGTKGQIEARESIRIGAASMNAVLLVLTLGVIMFFYFGQARIAFAIEQANSPSAIAKRQMQRGQQSPGAHSAGSPPASTR